MPLASLFQDDTEERGSSLDFSGVKIESLLEDQVDFETFSKSDFKRHPRLLRAGRADRKDPDCDYEPAAAAHDGH